jgi:hypothetical protein
MFDQSFFFQQLQELLRQTCNELTKPSVLYKPTINLQPDLKTYRALYGSIAGYGDTPANACSDFDTAWFKRNENAYQ